MIFFLPGFAVFNLNLLPGFAVFNLNLPGPDMCPDLGDLAYKH